MTPNQAAHLSKRARKLLRHGWITHRQLALLDCLVWSCRRPGSPDAIVSLTRLQSLAHMARETVCEGVRRLAALGLLTIIKRRVRCGWASRQATSRYRLCTESGGATVPYVQREERSIEPPHQAVAEAQRALAEVAGKRARDLGLARPLTRSGA